MQIFDASIRFILLLLTSILLQFLQGCGDLDVGSMTQMTKKSLVEITPEKEFAQMKKDAEDGDAEAQFFLGSMYIFGIDVPKNAAEAVEWLQKAAEQGHAHAQDFLGIIYQFGDEGVPKDATKAVKWLQQAAEQGHAMAQTELGARYRKGQGIPKNAAKAVEWWQKAAANGIADAQFNLGLLYVSEDGLPLDPVRAYGWLYLATVQGNVTASDLLSRIMRKMTPAQIVKGQRLASNYPREIDTLQVDSASVPVTAESVRALSKQGMGTAFVVSYEGHALTSQHVINDCKEVRVMGRKGTANIITSNSVNDLALLQFSDKNTSAASLNPDLANLRLGEDVIVFGYNPLNSMFLSDGNFTPGTLSGLTGLGNNTNQIQITAPIPLGSDGSLVLDKKGNVIGMISMKLDDRLAVEASGQIPQNVNFAVNGQSIKVFLDANKVPYKTGGGFFSFLSREKSNAKIAKKARKRAVIVECWK